MKNTRIGHLQFNVHPNNLNFYKELFNFLGWKPLYEEAEFIGLGDETGCSVWFVSPAKDWTNDYDGPGMNHLAIAVAAQSDVDDSHTYLQAHGIPALFETPRHRPEFSPSVDQTYYQVMFETPDRILFEIVYTGPKV